MSADPLVILSPHLDDAILSVGALIARESARGRKVDVWTFYTDGPPLEQIEEERRVFGDYAARKAEDARALAVVGAGHRWLDLPERLFRAPRLPKTTHVFHTPKREADFEILPRAREIVRGLLGEKVEILAPMGIGHHHDHVELSLAVLRELFDRGGWERVRFYEDPYSLGGACRKAHYVAKRRRWKTFESPAWSSPRVAALLRFVAALADGPGVDDYLPEAAKLDWSCEPLAVGRDDEDKKTAAVIAYSSQVKAFGGEHAVGAFMKRGHEILGGEPIWTARPG